jgi:membrane protein YqaA with SNARE-associated domain
MAKAMHLGAWFLTGCIASSLVAWLGSHPALSKIMWLIYGLFASAIVLMLLTDDAVRAFLKLNENDFYSLIIAASAAVLIGGIVTWLI